MTQKKRNLTLLCDFYELTMANGYFELNKGNEISYFDLFFRNVPDGGGFAIAAGLEQVIDYIENLFEDMKQKIETCPLPDTVDKAKVNELLIKARKLV